MANPVINNVDGSNPGPASISVANPQLPIGNLIKLGSFQITLTPVAVAAATCAEQAFASTGIGLLTTDLVVVQKPTAQAGLGIAGARVSAVDQLSINFVNPTAGSITPTAAEVYTVGVFRVQPNYVAPASGNQLSW